MQGMYSTTKAIVLPSLMDLKRSLVTITSPFTVSLDSRSGDTGMEEGLEGREWEVGLRYGSYDRYHLLRPRPPTPKGGLSLSRPIVTLQGRG